MSKAFLAQIISGKGRGRKLGFPTFNLVIPENFKAEEGIYAGYVYIEEKRYRAAVHFGPVPTFNEPTPSLEAFLIDGVPAVPLQQVSIELVQRLREVKRFSTGEELKAQMTADVAQVKNLLQL